MSLTNGILSSVDMVFPLIEISAKAGRGIAVSSSENDTGSKTIIPSLPPTRIFPSEVRTRHPSLNELIPSPLVVLKIRFQPASSRTIDIPCPDVTIRQESP